AAYEDNIPFLASALSFDLLLTVIPFVALLLAVVGSLVQHQVTTQQVDLHELLARFLPTTPGGSTDRAFQAVESTLSGVVRHRGRAVVLRHLQAAPQPADPLAHGGGRRGLLLARLRGGETIVRALRAALRDARSPRLGRQRGGPRPVPAVGVLHRLSLPLGRRGGRDLRPDAHATLAARAAGVTAPRPIDLRSDTVTRPSPAMRRAMAEAPVGDDVLDGDPTTRRLERRVAELLGLDDALFFPSGTQANQTGIALLTRPGTELVVEANAHLVHYELAGVAALAGVQIRPVTTPDGLLT